MTGEYESWLAEALEGDRDEATILYWTHLTQALGVLLLVLGFVAGAAGVNTPSFVSPAVSDGSVPVAAVFFGRRGGTYSHASGTEVGPRTRGRPHQERPAVHGEVP
jgi:hypothetical protein